MYQIQTYKLYVQPLYDLSVYFSFPVHLWKNSKRKEMQQNSGNTNISHAWQIEHFFEEAMIPIPYADRGKGDHKNVIAIVHKRSYKDIEC